VPRAVRVEWQWMVHQRDVSQEARCAPALGRHAGRAPTPSIGSA